MLIHWGYPIFRLTHLACWCLTAIRLDLWNLFKSTVLRRFVHRSSGFCPWTPSVPGPFPRPRRLRGFEQRAWRGRLLPFLILWVSWDRQDPTSWRFKVGEICWRFIIFQHKFITPFWGTVSNLELYSWDTSGDPGAGEWAPWNRSSAGPSDVDPSKLLMPMVFVMNVVCSCLFGLEKSAWSLAKATFSESKDSWVSKVVLDIIKMAMFQDGPSDGCDPF